MSKSSKIISNTLTQWYNFNKRDLPWRQTSDPYLIWVSEVILQQTRVVQGYEYYLRFVEALPDVKSLANTSEDDVLKLWQGLGYYSRARNLHVAAKTIASEYDGIFPSEYKNIIGLKGIGEYTAAAIASFAFNLPHAVVDGNVFRVLSRLFAIDTPIDSTQGKKLFTELANNLLDRENPGLHNQAIMEFGALYCTPTSANCMECMFSDKCLAYANKEVTKYPIKQNKAKIKERYFNYLDIRCHSHLFLNKRTANDIWKNLYELPLIETDKKMSFEELQNTDAFNEIFKSPNNIQIKSTNISLKHILSHRIIYANFYQIEITDDSYIRDRYMRISTTELHSYAISRLVDKYFELSNSPTLFP